MVKSCTFTKPAMVHIIHKVLTNTNKTRTRRNRREAARKGGTLYVMPAERAAFVNEMEIIVSGTSASGFRLVYAVASFLDRVECACGRRLPRKRMR